MIFRTIHNSRITALVTVFFVLLLLWGRLFIINMIHVTTFDNPCMPLWEHIIDPIFGYSKYTAAVLSLILAFLIAFSLNRVTLKFGLIQQQSMLPFFIYALLSSGFLFVQKLNPVWIFTLFFILGMEQLFSSVGKGKPQVGCFNASLLVGIGSLFYAKGIFLFAVFFVLMGILRIANHKSVIASLFGLMLPFAVGFVYFLYTDNTLAFFADLQENLLSNPGQYNHTIFSRIYIGIMILANVVSIILSFNYMKSQKILTRRYFRCFTWMMFIISAAVLTPFFSMELIPVIALVSTVIISLWLDKMRKPRLKEVTTWFLIALTVMGQVFNN